MLPRVVGLQGRRGRPVRGEVRRQGTLRPRQLRHRGRAGRPAPRLRRVRRQAGLVGHRGARAGPLRGRPREVGAEGGRLPRREARSQRGRRHGLQAVGRGDGQAPPRTAGPRAEDAAPLPVDAVRRRVLGRRSAPRYRRQGRARRRLGRVRRQGSRVRRVAGDVHLGPDAATALDRRGAVGGVLPGRQHCWPSAGSARSATSTTWTARRASSCSTGGRRSRWGCSRAASSRGW